MWFRFSRMASSLKRKTEFSTKNKQGESEKKKKFMPFSMGLKQSMEDPELQIFSDDKITIIKDKYPKAHYHFLVLPKESIPNLKSLKKEHISLLHHMEVKGKELAKKSSDVLPFRYGYHAIPSMSHVHLHVISQDFDSPSLKTKKHWNSFTTEYFIDSKDIIKMLEEEGKVAVDTSRYGELLKKSLECHRCGEDFTTMPALKKHLLKHKPKDT